jgi:PTS system nitrogen regulatory IIA component
MGVVEILAPNRVSIAGSAEGEIRSKPQAIKRLAALLAEGVGPASAVEIEQSLIERERLSSTGVGGGVAIPHAGLDSVNQFIGAMLLCPEAIAFDAIDGAPVSILFAVIGPRHQRVEHLKALARVSRLLRDEEFRARLLRAGGGAQAFALIAAEEGRVSHP